MTELRGIPISRSMNMWRIICDYLGNPPFTMEGPLMGHLVGFSESEVLNSLYKWSWRDSFSVKCRVMG